MQERVAAVQKMQDYIEQHINEDITLADLARVSLFSPWYSYRLFKEYTTYTPSDYIRRIRLSKSAIRLRDEKVRVLDIALEMGFQSVDGYQRAFVREFGCNPGEYAKKPIPIQLFIPYGVKFEEIRKEYKMEHVKNVFIQLIQKPERNVMLRRGEKARDYFEYCEEMGCDVWGMLLSIKPTIGEPVAMWLPKEYRPQGTSEYVQGVEIPPDYNGVIPDQFEIVKFPATEYMMFQGEPFMEEEYLQAIGEVQEAIEKYNPSFLGYEWDTTNPRIQLEPVGKRGYIEMLAVKRR